MAPNPGIILGQMGAGIREWRQVPSILCLFDSAFVFVDPPSLYCSNLRAV